MTIWFLDMANAQNLPECPPGIVFVDDCTSACLVCNFQNPVNINNGNFTPDFPNDDCLNMHNNMWFAFRAYETSVTLNAIPSNCWHPTGGIQMAMYDDCAGQCIFRDWGCDGAPVSITATGLSIGTVYYLVIDGCGFNVCDVVFTVDPISAITGIDLIDTAPIQGPSNPCPNGTYTYCTEHDPDNDSYEWIVPPGVTANGIAGPTVVLPAPGGACPEITFGPNPGPTEICVRARAGCSLGTLECLPVTKTILPETVMEPIVVCHEEAFFYSLPWGAFIQTTPGTSAYQYSYVTENGCDSLVKVSVTVLPELATFLPIQFICPDECVLVEGMPFCTQGFFVVKVTASTGCDSSLKFNVIQIDVDADIAQADTLSCKDLFVTLNSSALPNNSIAWTNASGQVLGTADSLVVSQVGTYYLSVTKTSGNLSCTDIDSVAVQGDTIVPSLSLSADTLGCGTNPALIQVTTDSIPAAYLWSGPGSFSAAVADTLVLIPGLYHVTVTSLVNGCTNSGSINVPINFLPPDVAIDSIG
ncbi:MAG: hypothetical protein ACKVU0_20590, partial [Saprospiraceae bacterium]